MDWQDHAKKEIFDEWAELGYKVESQVKNSKYLRPFRPRMVACSVPNRRFIFNLQFHQGPPASSSAVTVFPVLISEFTTRTYILKSLKVD
jgi:hypothetical protein